MDLKRSPIDLIRSYNMDIKRSLMDPIKVLYGKRSHMVIKRPPIELKSPRLDQRPLILILFCGRKSEREREVK